jgi:hypothetical protein
MSATANVSVIGHVLIKDKRSGDVLLNKNNAVHSKNLALAIARGLANQDNHEIYQIKLGNGGSSVDSLNQISFLPPNVTSASATLYNETYFEVVDGLGAHSAAGPADNSVTILESPAPATSVLVIVSATISANEPSGQALTDASPDTTDEYAFDELGLFTSDNKLLSHIIFSPILKTANRELVITYTLTVSVS